MRVFIVDSLSLGVSGRVSCFCFHSEAAGRRISPERSFTSFRMTEKALRLTSVIDSLARPFDIVRDAALGIVLGSKTGFLRQARDVDAGVNIHRRPRRRERPRSVAQMNFDFRQRFFYRRGELGEA